MKFNVTNNGLGTYDVRLHWETKNKIKTILFWTSLVVGSAAAGRYLATMDDTEELE